MEHKTNNIINKRNFPKINSSKDLNKMFLLRVYNVSIRKFVPTKFHACFFI